MPNPTRGAEQVAKHIMHEWGLSIAPEQMAAIIQSSIDEAVGGIVGAYVESLTPSAETKAAYSGEFYFTVTMGDDEGNDLVLKHCVPWTTIKEIMAVILNRAANAPKEEK